MPDPFNLTFLVATDLSQASRFPTMSAIIVPTPSYRTPVILTRLLQVSMSPSPDALGPTLLPTPLDRAFLSVTDFTQLSLFPLLSVILVPACLRRTRSFVMLIIQTSLILELLSMGPWTDSSTLR